MKRLLKHALRGLTIRLLLARERLESGATFNLISSEARANPYPTYQRLRERSPVHRSRLANAWILTKHSDIDAVLRDQKRFGNDERKAVDRLRNEQVDDEMRSMLRLDPPDHTRLRALVNKAFTPRAVQSLKPRVEEIVDELLDEIDPDKPFDVIQHLAYPLPMTVIAEMLGVPTEDRERFNAWSHDVALGLEGGRTREENQRLWRSRQELAEYFASIIEQRRDDPRDDMISALIAAEEERDKLSHPEMLAMLVLLLVAGNETTKNLIGNGLLALLHNPEQIKRLREEPDLIEAAIDELLRFDSSVQIDGRVALEDVEIGGKRIKAGQRLILLIGAANRDPDVFDAPDQLDVTRSDGNHVSFGRGVHHCLGAQLARIESQAAFSKLLTRFPDLHLVHEPKFRDQIVLRGLEALWVESGPKVKA